MQSFVAQSGISILIYLVVGVVWIIGKVSESNKAKAKVEEMKRRREEREREERRTGHSSVPPPPAPAPRTLDKELEDFLGRLAGESSRPSPPPPPPMVAPRPVVVFDNKPAPPPPPRRPAAPPKAPPPLPAVSAATLSEEAIAFKPMENIREAEEVMHKGGLSEQTSLLNVRTLMVDMSRTSPRIPTIGTASMRSISTSTAKPNLRKPATLRRAVIANMLLEPPKALM